MAMPSRSGVIAAVVSAAVAIVSLNIPWLQFEPLLLWVRVLCPLLLLLGLWGSIYNSRIARLLGWLGILVFMGCAIGMVLPGDDYMSGDPDGPALDEPRLVSGRETLGRLLFCVSLIVALIWSYVRIGRARRKT